MSSLIVIRILPQQTLDPAKFTTYLNPPGLGPLQITAYELTFNDPVQGRKLATATYVAATTPPSPTAAVTVPPAPVFKTPVYGASPANGIVQQYDLAGAAPPDSAYFQLEAVANAIIEIPTAVKIENVRLEAQWGSGAAATPIKGNFDFYNIPLSPGPTPDLNAWAPSTLSTAAQPDPWGALFPSFYFHLPQPASSSGAFSFKVPTDGTAPAFDELLKATQQILSQDPGGAVIVATSAGAAIGASALKFPASTAGISAGMSVSGAGVPSGTTVVKIDGAGLVTLSHELAAPVGAGISITFTPNLGALTLEQCRNIAYEIVWIQQPPAPTPPDPVEDLYTNPPNTGPLLSGTTPNQFEADRRQFEAELTSYYALADAAADRLTTFIFALSAAVACEQSTLAAQEAVLELPPSPGGVDIGALSGHKILLTGVDAVDPPVNFGVPAAFFYALGARLPPQISPAQRLQLATRDRLTRLLTELTSGIQTGLIADSETFVAIPLAGINAAQAARRLVAHGVPRGEALPRAPLGARALPTLAATTAGSSLTFASTAGLTVGMRVGGANIAPGTTISALTATTVTLNVPPLGDVKAGETVAFAPPYPAGLVTLLNSWLGTPPSVTGSISSESYIAGQDVAQFWPSAEAAQPAAYLDLVLSALTEGYIVPAPFNAPLGGLIITTLLPVQTVAALAAVTRAEWTDFFEKHPTWLPPGTGNVSARIASFIRRVQNFILIGGGGPTASFVLVTTAFAPAGSTVLQFVPTTAIVVGMSVVGPGIAPGTTVASVATTSTATSVTLSTPVEPAGVPVNANIKFSVNALAAAALDWDALPLPSQDWFTKCLTAYGPFVLGSGFDAAKLRAAAAVVFPGDELAQDWIASALEALDAMYAVLNTVPIPPPATGAFRFSLAEALYARGFTAAAKITALSNDDFERALTGTVAFDLAGAIYTAATAIVPAAPAAAGVAGFAPINPDGSLSNCIPSPCSSPLGPVAYLNEMLGLSALSTCETTEASPVSLPTSAATAAGTALPFVSTKGLIRGMSATGANIPVGTTVADVKPASVVLSAAIAGALPAGSVITFTAAKLLAAISRRRGPIGDLAASCANLETPLPAIDLVNECLEFMGAAAKPASGTVYDTSADDLAGHALCQPSPCPPAECDPPCHPPERIFAALPEYSTPASPVAANGAVTPAVWNVLKKDFSSCHLPYSQALDVSRTYLREFGSCRVEEMRTFRKCITEFVLDPANEPAGFQDHLWRFPVRIDIAIEYLGITPEEYQLLFAGTPAPDCAAPPADPARPDPNQPDPNRPDPAQPDPNRPIGGVRRAAAPAPWELYGFQNPDGNGRRWTEQILQVREFLARTCLSYCEFYELWKSGFVAFTNGNRRFGNFPECEPCCLDDLSIRFIDGEGDRFIDGNLRKLAVFIRLWRKLKESCCFCYTWAQLRDICNVLRLFDASGTLNPEFIRQLAAFQMLRDHFGLDLTDPSEPVAPTAVDADRTHILALWVGPTAARWGWAVRHLCWKIVHHARRYYRCEERSQEFVECLTARLDRISALLGFDPLVPADTWYALPTHTLRFAEVLAKIAASRFTVDELLFLFTADDERCGEIFPTQDECDGLDQPLDLPAGEHEFSLRHLRRNLLCAAPACGSEEAGVSISLALDHGTGTAADCDHEDQRWHERREIVHVAATISRECADEWDWRRVEKVLEEELGFALDDILTFGRHFFPQLLQKAGYLVDQPSRRFTSSLPAAQTAAALWSAADGPFQYDAAAGTLWTHLPLADRSVIAQLVRLNALNANEQRAVQDLYFQPRAMLAIFALLFPDFPAAERHLIEESDECERWEYFRRRVEECHNRCHIIARHLAGHVAWVTRQPCPEGEAVAMLILRELFGDENLAKTDWEQDSGNTPAVTWTPPANGGAFAALLGLSGTGLVAEHKVAGGGLVWRSTSGSLNGFGSARDAANAPVPTVLPSLAATITPAQAAFVSVRNGFLVKNGTGALLGGAQGFETTWSGALLVEEEGSYEFCADVPSPAHDHRCCEPHDVFKWRVTLSRGSKTWVVVSHRWPGEEERRSSSRLLKCGAYGLTVELVRPTPNFTSAEHVHPQYTGLEVMYSGPDTCGERMPIPHRQLFSVVKDDTLGQGIVAAAAGASQFLERQYTSTLRDIRRTYQRAFKAMLFAHRFSLEARRNCHGTSELGYMLEEAVRFAGESFFKAGAVYTRHAANFDFDFLPVADEYHSPAGDSRTKPSAKRTQAMFDWWERIFDYTIARADVCCRHHRPLWHLFADARATHQTDPVPLLSHLGVDPRWAKAVLRFCQGQAVPVFAVGSGELQDDRWTIRAWHADRWLSAVDCHFAPKSMEAIRPDLWASEDPSALVAAETQTGNANLLAFVCDGFLEHGNPRRYDELRRLNDGLRRRGRDALLAFLCQLNRVELPWAPGQFATNPRDLSDLLLLDVEAGICERISRIEDAIAAVQAFVRRARLRLETSWTVTAGFAEVWDREFATFHIWQACKRRRLYQENWVEWSDLEKARKVEAFQMLEGRLNSSALSAVIPGGSEWWPDQHPPASQPEVLQAREPSWLRQLAAPREGLQLLGTPERDGRPSWLAALEPAPAGGGPLPGSQPIPLWMEAAIRVGTRFFRIAAAGIPPAASLFEPHIRKDDGACVTCCQECGCSHPNRVDEYFFWIVPASIYEPPASAALAGGPVGYVSSGDFQNGFQDDYYDPIQQQSAVWQDPQQLPQLLYWQPKPAVRLAWCRIHNGEFQQPRQSELALRVDDVAASDLAFLGRTVDSLTFSVSNGIPAPGYTDPSAPGFRFDMPADAATLLPEIVAPKTPPTFLAPANLPAYPWFLFHDPGASLLPLSPFSPALTVAQFLRSQCRFEAALAWYRTAFDPLTRDNTWIECGGDDGDDRERQPAEACCDSTDISCDQARNRAVVLHYLETLVEWGGAIARQGRSAEALRQSRVIFDTAARILGSAPRVVKLPAPASPPKVSEFSPLPPPINPRLMNLYETVRDRLESLRACANDRRLRDGSTHSVGTFFGDDPSREGWRAAATACETEAEACFLSSPYRFTFLVEKAQEYAARVQELGNALLSACEKGDAEFLASVRANQERELLALGLNARKDAWREADWQIESLQKAKAMAQANLDYFTQLKALGLNSGEVTFEALTAASMVLRGTGNLLEAVAGGMSAAGNYFSGVAGFGGSPLIYAQLPPGEPLAGDFAANARIMVALGDIANTTASLSLTQSGWDRRLDEWNHQIDVLTIEIQQIERQILGAQRRRDQLLSDLNSFARQLEQAREIQDFLRDKFTSHALYLYLQKETSALQYMTYDLASRVALQAQFAFNLESGHTMQRFLPECGWSSLHEGLLAGEKLSAALRQMQKAYLDGNAREYELIKQISLRQHFPAQFLKLRLTGQCEIEIPEWMFDLDFPGHFMRRIKSLNLTIPCVTGPYTGVHCRLTLLGSQTRTDPRLSAPPHECCCPPAPCGQSCCEDERLAHEYRPCPDDPRIVRQHGAREAIATSTGQNDAGLFALDFNDLRYLPFEYMGGASRWRVEVPPENNYFDIQTMTDFNLRLGLISREGGPLLRRAAQAASKMRLPGDGWRLIDVEHEFPDAWHQLTECGCGNSGESRLRLRLERRMFPFVPGSCGISIKGIALVFGSPDACDPCDDFCDPCGPASTPDCPCPGHPRPARCFVDFRQGDLACDHPSQSVECIRNGVWGDAYAGSLHTHIDLPARKGRHERVEFVFHLPARHLDNCFLLCRYAAS
ncbi:MAG: neuraminidase-like domain-containing protein [Bryobacteraceae bacterium]